jgi:excisionase family DNA binding protein
MAGNYQKQIMTTNERWLSVTEIAAHLGVNPDTIYKWIERKKLPAHKVGRLWKFLASEVDQWVKAGHAAQDVTAGTPGAPRKRKPPAK